MSQDPQLVMLSEQDPEAWTVEFNGMVAKIQSYIHHIQNKLILLPEYIDILYGLKIYYR